MAGGGGADMTARCERGGGKIEIRTVYRREGERLDDLRFLQRDLAGAKTLCASARVFE